jgi:hemerythrin-like domain-containing protein
MRRDPRLIPLSHQHHNGLALCVLVERSLRADSSTENLRRLARRILDRFDLELVNHFELEEQLLFPAAAMLPHLAPLAAVLVADHRRLESFAAALRAAPSAETVLAFTALLRCHIRREESELFEQAQRDLAPADLDRMGVEFRRRAIRICL